MMKSEEEFLNILKDCWTGRVYFSTSTIIEIIEDDGCKISFKLSWIHDDTDYDPMPTFNVSNKQDFIDGLNNATCYRVK